MLMWRWQALVLVLVGGLGAALVAQEKQPLTLREREPLVGPQYNKTPEAPPKELRDWMKANNTVMSVDGTGAEGGGGAADATPGGAAGGGVVSFQGTLSRYLTAQKEDYDGVLKDTATLKANFEKIEGYFAERKSADGVMLAKAAQQGVADMETAARAKSRVGALKAQIAVSVACRNCHIAHRVLVITMPMSFGVIG
jgi:hypothetical protein